MISQKDEVNNSSCQKLSDFSIEHILNRAGKSFSGNNITSAKEREVTSQSLRLDNFSWLQCSRYCPPKVPRIHRKEPPQKRQLGRHPRIPFTSTQLSTLEQKFQESPYLSSDEVTMLSRKLQLADIRVKIWFQNRRARERREKHQNRPSACDKEENKRTVNEDIIESEVKFETDFNQCTYNNFHSSNNVSLSTNGIVIPIFGSASATAYNSFATSYLSSPTIPFLISSNTQHSGLGEDSR